MGFGTAELAMRDLLGPKLQPLKNQYDSSSTYFEEYLDFEEDDVDQEPAQLESQMSITSPSESQNLRKRASDSKYDNKRKCPKLAKVSYEPGKSSSVQEEILVLKRENLIKANDLLDLQIKQAELDIKNKEVDLKLKMNSVEHEEM